MALPYNPFLPIEPAVNKTSTPTSILNLSATSPLIRTAQAAELPAPEATPPPVTSPSSPPSGSPQPTQGTGQGTTSTQSGTSTQTGTSSPFLMQQVLDTLNNRYQSNNVLMTQRNLVLKHLYDQPLTPDELNQLDPSLKQAVESGDRNQVDMQLRLISDQVAGRTNSLDQSIHYLTNSYQDQLQQAETQKKDAISAIINYSKNFVDPNTGLVNSDEFKQAITQLYGAEYAPLVDSISGMVAPATFRDNGFAPTTPDSPSSSIGGSSFYKNPDSEQVYTADGKAIDLPTFKEMTQQTDVPDDQVNFASVKTINPVQTASTTGKKVTLTEATNKIDSFLHQGNEALGYQGVGKDGYVSPLTYNAARDAWIKDGQSVSTFDTRFAKYINPGDPQDYLGAKPVKKTASTSSLNISPDLINQVIDDKSK